MAVYRQDSFLDGSDCSFRGASARAKEVAGRTTAECAAVCCCCPCVLVEVVVLAVYKLPAGICRKAKRRRRLMKKTPPPPLRRCSCDEQEFHIRPLTPPTTTTLESALESIPKNSEVTELETEMLEKFRNGGFWRSSSRRSEM